MKKQQYGKGRPIFATDHNDAQNYMEENVKELAADSGLAGGILQGGNLIPENPASWNVILRALTVARDPYGERIYIDSDQAISMQPPTDPESGNEYYLSAYVKYVYATAEQDFDSDGNNYYKKYSNAFYISVASGLIAATGSAVKSPIPQDSLCLCDILITQDVYTRGTILAEDIDLSRQVRLNKNTSANIDAYFDTSSVDTEIARFDGTTGKKIKSTPATPPLISDSGNVFVQNADDSTSKDSGCLVAAGGIGVEKNITSGARISAGHSFQIPDWSAAKSYIAGDMIKKNNTVYLCVINHTSSIFNADWLTNACWVPLGDAPGMMKEWTAATAPAGYMLCDGKTVGNAASGADYSGEIYRELYEVLKATFGGTYNWDTNNKINLPDMRGVFPKGAGTTGRANGKDANGNYYAATLGAYNQDKMQGHRHNKGDLAIGASGSHNHVDSGHTHTVSSSMHRAAAGGAPGGNLATSSTYPTTEAGYANIQPNSHGHSNADMAGSPGVASTDGANGTPRTGTTTEPQSLGITFIIKY